MDRSVFLQFWFKQLISHKQKMPRTPHMEGNLFSRKVLSLNLFVLSSSHSLPNSHLLRRSIVWWDKNGREGDLSSPCYVHFLWVMSWWDHKWLETLSPAAYSDMTLYFGHLICRGHLYTSCKNLIIGIYSLSIFVEKEHLLWLVSG